VPPHENSIPSKSNPIINFQEHNKFLNISKIIKHKKDNYLIKINANSIPKYSMLNPEINSDSFSTKSIRLWFISAKIPIKKQENVSITITIFHIYNCYGIKLKNISHSKSLNEI